MKQENLSTHYATVPSLSNIENVGQSQNLTGRDVLASNFEKQASGRMTPPSGFSGSNQNKSSRLAAGERFDSQSNIDETGSAHISNEQSANERFAPFNGFRNDDLQSVDANKPRGGVSRTHTLANIDNGSFL
jgi:hypothetical protein